LAQAVTTVWGFVLTSILTQFVVCATIPVMVMEKKVQTSLLAVNIGVLAIFMAGVAVILYNEEPVPPLADVSAAEAPAHAWEPTLRTEASVASGAEDGTTPVASTGKCDKEKDKDKCAERSLMVPIVFAFLAGGLINLPEVSSLPCI